MAFEIAEFATTSPAAASDSVASRRLDSAAIWTDVTTPAVKLAIGLGTGLQQA